MASLANAIRSFQSGDLSHHEFFAQVDRVLATEKGNSKDLLDILSEEHTRILLPPDVYTELQRRIEHVVAAERHDGGDETRVQTNPRDRRSTSSFPSGPPNFGEEDAEPARMKGVGDTLNGRFVLEECIGFGGMGTVYKALDLRKLEASDRKPYVAIKVLNVHFRGHPKSLITLQREAKKAQALAHPNIVTVYDFDRDGSVVYLTMEYLAGRPLSQVLRIPGFAGMPYADAMRIVGGVGKALSYAHERGFVHCDLKPANIFLTDKGEVKVIDFGIARALPKKEEDAEATVFDPGTLGGLTPAYASPEMIEHLAPDPRDDIYALACITYELLTGRHPFDRLSATQARAAGMKPQRPKNLGHKQWRTLRTALSFERATRTPTVARFMQEMSGERRTSEYAALAASVLALGVLSVGALGYYLNSLTDYFAQPVTAETPAEALPESPPAPAPIAAEEAPAPAPEPPPVARQDTPAPAPPPVARQEAAPAPPALSMAAVEPVLARVPCSALAASVGDGRVQVQGYVPKEYGAARLKEALGNIPGVKNVALDVQQVDNDKCEMIRLLAPYWTSNQLAGRAASMKTKKPASDLREGDPLIVDVTTPGYDSHVHVDYFSFDGNVVHLVPSWRARPNQAPPNYSATIGSMGEWVVSKPFGTDMMVLLITPVPIFDKLRPEFESASEYLQALGKQLGQIADKHGTGRIAVDFVQVTTKAKS